MITKRLKKIASYIEPYKTIADVGSDHGYLVSYAFECCHISNAQCIENKKQPLENTKNNTYLYQDKIVYSLSSGLSQLETNIDVVVIAGMGGTLISSILKEGMLKGKLANVKRIIVQPNRNSYDIRNLMIDSPFNIVDEAIVEDGKYYEIIVYERNDEVKLHTELEKKYGPILLSKRPALFLKKLEEELCLLKAIPVKTDALKIRIQEIEDILC